MYSQHSVTRLMVCSFQQPDRRRRRWCNPPNHPKKRRRLVRSHLTDLEQLREVLHFDLGSKHIWLAVSRSMPPAHSAVPFRALPICLRIRFPLSTKEPSEVMEIFYQIILIFFPKFSLLHEVVQIDDTFLFFIPARSDIVKMYRSILLMGTWTLQFQGYVSIN